MPQTFDSTDDTETVADSRPHQALSTMINQGRSFSGNERNCCFLNIGAPTVPHTQFANISAASGLDYPDDGRAVAMTDWDADGDVDLWISNRNAPRLRFMRNDTGGQNHYALLRLNGNGDDTNRDAVGARVALHAIGESGAKRLIKTLRAGDGFLSQSSKWLHFGLGAADTIDRVVVTWPCRNSEDDKTEVFTGLAIDRRYLLRQGAGKPVPIPRGPSRARLEPSVPKIPAPTHVARIPAVTLLRGPRLKIRSESGEVVSPGDGRPVLINLFASWCPACIQELVTLRDHQAEIRAAGIQIVALSVDGLGHDTRSDPESARRALLNVDFPFASATASRDLLDSLQGYHNALVTLQRPLPLPSSFLIDADGRVAVMYKGPLRVEDLLADGRQSNGTRLQRWKRAALVPGSTITHENVVRTAENVEAAMHFRYGLYQEEQGSLDDAAYHFQQALRSKSDFVLARRYLAQVYLKRNDADAAQHLIHEALRMSPDDPELHYLAAKLCLQLNDSAQARVHYEQAIRHKPDHVPALFDLAAIRHALGQTRQAMILYRTVLEFDADHVSAQNNLAWLLATHPDETIRDGPESLRIAEDVVRQTGGEQPFFLDLLAAALAECGRFDHAAETARRALDAARESNDLTLVTEIEGRLRGYERHQPHREPAVQRP